MYKLSSIPSTTTGYCCFASLLSFRFLGWHACMACPALVAAEIRDEPECLPALWFRANIGPVARVNPHVLCPSPWPLERHAAALPWAFQWTVIGVNLAVLQQILVREELPATALLWADIILMQRQRLFCAKTHGTAFNVARILFLALWRTWGSPSSVSRFLHLLLFFYFSPLLT